MTYYINGERYDAFRGEDGLFLTIGSDGITLLCRMARPKSDEKSAFHAGKPIDISMGIVGSVVYWTVRFGSLERMDCTWSPRIGGVPELAQLSDASHGYALHVMLADAATGELVRQRVIGLPHDFSLAVYDAVHAANLSPAPYPESLGQVYALDTRELDRRSFARCSM